MVQPIVLEPKQVKKCDTCGQDIAFLQNKNKRWYVVNVDYAVDRQPATHKTNYHKCQKSKPQDAASNARLSQLISSREALDIIKAHNAGEVKQISCGCCTKGCVCTNHMDIPRGERPRKCALHSGTGEVQYINV